MSVLNIENLQAKKEAIEKKEREASEWCAEALNEFVSAAKSLNTPPAGAKPSYWSDVDEDYGKMFAHGVVYSVLVGNSFDDYTHNEVSGSNVTADGVFWRNAEKQSAKELGRYIASAVHYSIPIAERLFEAALLGNAWTVDHALDESE